MSIQILVDNHKLLWMDDRNHGTNHDMAPTLSTADMEWNERFESLLNFGDEFGHCNVPVRREYPLPSGAVKRWRIVLMTLLIIQLHV